MKTNFILFAFVILFTTTGFAEVHTYSYPDVVVETAHKGINKRSEKYSVRIVQNENADTCYVMYDPNIGEAHMSGIPNNHWTNFSSSGIVSIEIERLDGIDISSCKVYPATKGFTANYSGTKATIQVEMGDTALQLYVQMNGLSNNPLFVFCDPIETDVPDTTNHTSTIIIKTSDDIATVHSKLTGSHEYIVFEKGIHDWNHFTEYLPDGNQPGNRYITEGYKMPLRSNKKIYIPGGAYVIGSFDNSGISCSNLKIYGRGVISACGLEEITGTTGIPYSMIHITVGSVNTIEGIVSTNPPHFHATIRSNHSVVRNIKMFAWWYSTDGTVTGDYSTVDDCFFKLNDDAIKLYGFKCTHNNNTMYHQKNGAPFQFSWGNQNGDSNLVTNTYIVNSVYKNINSNSGNNTAIINAVAGGNSSNVVGNTFDGLFIDNGCHRLIGLNSDNSGRTYKGMVIKNVTLNSGDKSTPQAGASYFEDGSFEEIVFVNLIVDGNLIDTTDYSSDKPSEGKLWFRKLGTVTGNPEFTYVNDDPTAVPQQPQVTLWAYSCNSVELTWYDYNDNSVLNFNLKRREPGELNYEVIAEILPYSKKYVDETVSAEIEYEYVLDATNSLGTTSSNTIEVTTTACMGFPIPGTLEAENMTNHHPDVRNDEGDFISFIKDGYWAEYAIDPEVSGDYKIDIVYGSASNAGGDIGVSINGNTLNTITLPPSTAWSNWLSESVIVPLNSTGTQTIRFNFIDTESGTNEYLYNIDKFVFSLANATPKTMLSNTSVFPNPFTNRIILKGVTSKIELYNVAGEVQKVKQYSQNDGVVLHTHNLPSGVYIIKYNNQVKKLIKP